MITFHLSNQKILNLIIWQMLYFVLRTIRMDCNISYKRKVKLRVLTFGSTHWLFRERITQEVLVLGHPRHKLRSNSRQLLRHSLEGLALLKINKGV